MSQIMTLRELPAKWRDAARRIDMMTRPSGADMARAECYRARADELATALSARDEAGSWNAAIEAAAQEAEHWQERSTPHHECGRYIAGAIRARFATPPAASGDVERAIRGVAQWLLHRFGPNTPEANEATALHAAADRLAAVAPAGMVRCSHNWLDYGEHAGNNLAYCPRCKMISAVGKEGVPYGLPTPPATAGQE